ncbi:MAG: type II secretion system protein [Myxococcota bacterium]
MRQRALERGLTLIELGLVLAIITVIVSVTVPRVSAIAETAKQEATAKDLINLSLQTRRIIEQLAYPQPTGGAGVVIPRTDLSNIGSSGIPADFQQAMTNILPLNYAGTNPINEAPYFLTLAKMNLGGFLSHDIYQVTLDTCVPSSQTTLTTVIKTNIEVDCTRCGGDDCLVSNTQMVELSETARRLRKDRRLLYCCEATADPWDEPTNVDCSNYRTGGSSPVNSFTNLGQSFLQQTSESPDQAINRYCR